MRILFDQGTPVPLRQHLSSHDVATAFELGWSSIANGELLARAEVEGFDVPVAHPNVPAGSGIRRLDVFFGQGHSGASEISVFHTTFYTCHTDFFAAMYAYRGR